MEPQSTFFPELLEAVFASEGSFSCVDPRVSGEVAACGKPFVTRDAQKNSFLRSYRRRSRIFHPNQAELSQTVPVDSFHPDKCLNCTTSAVHSVCTCLQLLHVSENFVSHTTHG